MTATDRSDQPPGGSRPAEAGGGPAGRGDATRAAHAGLPAAEAYQPALPGPVFAAHYHLPGDPAGAPYGYGRNDNPTWTALERAITELESPAAPAATLVFGSGMAAIAAVLFGHLRPGDAVVVPADGYHGVRALGAQLTAFGVEVRAVATGAVSRYRRALSGARLLLLETPANPGLDVCDIRELSRAAHAAGALVAVDNTLATPVFQRPLELGADLSVASGTKALNGHGDVLLGYVTGTDQAPLRPVRAWRDTVGAVLGPMEAWLAHRGLATLPLRLARQQSNALAVAEWLRHHAPDIRGVRYPGLPDDPAHTLASQQMRGYGGVVSFVLPDRAAAERFLGALRLAGEATSFGGVRSTAERRARWTEDQPGPAIPAGFVRLSLGVEDPADVLADVRCALRAALRGSPAPD